MEQKYQMGTESGSLLWNIGRMLEDAAAFRVVSRSITELAEGNPFHGDPEYAMETDLTKPLILAELQEGKYKLLDGNHRLYKARALHVDRLPVYFLTREEHIRYIENYEEETYRKIKEDLFGRDL